MLINSRLLMSEARYFTNEQQINPYYHDESVDVVRAQAEHDEIRSYLEQADVQVTQVAAPADSQDGVYTANWALVRGDKAVLARLPEARKSEETWARRELEALGLEVITVPEDWHFSGQGDALACGDYLFCGQGYRSDVRAQEFAADTLGYTRIQLQTVPQLDTSGKPVVNKVSGWPDSFYYDIDLALSIIRPATSDHNGLVAYCPAAFTEDSVAKLSELHDIDLIEISEQEATEAFACNLVSTGETVVMSDQAPLLRTELESRGLRILTPHITELIKGGGYIRCTTLTLF